MEKVWVLLADATYARILATEGRVGQHLTEIETLTHPESRAAAMDLTDGKPGRSWDGSGDGRHAMEDPTDPKTKEEQNFAREIAHRLGEGYQAGEFRHLVIVAPPRVLGSLRKAVSGQVASAISAEVHKDVVRERPEQARKHLPDFLY